MTGPPPLPDGFVVRLHDDVEIGPVVIAGNRVLRLSTSALGLIADRVVTVATPQGAALAGRLLDLDLADPVLDPAAASSPTDLTVVVPVRDNPAGVDRLLARLSPRLHCIVVDDASADPRAVAAVSARHGATLVPLDHNVGPAAARNAGLRRVTTSCIAFVDSDVDVSAEALEQLARHLADPALALVAPRVRTPVGPRAVERYEAACGSLDLGPVAATVRPWSSVTYVPSACLVARTAALGPGFDPRMRCGEDVDLVWRVQADGWRVRYAAEVDAHHDVRASTTRWLSRKAFYGSSAALLAQRHGDRVAPAVMTPAVATIAVGLLLQRRWSLAVAAVAAAGFVREAGGPLSGVPPRRRAAVVASSGAVMVGQVGSLMLRHWWPLAGIASLASGRARRAVAAVAVVDGLVAHRRSGADLDAVRFTLARRAADVAYGAGVWWGAARAGSARCLVPRWVSPPRRGRRA